MNFVTLGAALGQRRRAEGAEQGMATLGRALDETTETVVSLCAQLRAAKDRIATLERDLLVKKASAEGLDAYLAAFKAAHPDSPELRDSGKRYKSGNVKTVGSLRYAAAFDRFLTENGITDPVQYRAD